MKRLALVAATAFLFAFAPMPARADHYVIHNWTGSTAWVTFYTCPAWPLDWLPCEIMWADDVPSQSKHDKSGKAFETEMEPGVHFQLRIEIKGDGGYPVDQTLDAHSTSPGMVWHACIVNRADPFRWCVIPE